MFSPSQAVPKLSNYMHSYTAFLSSCPKPTPSSLPSEALIPIHV